MFVAKSSVAMSSVAMSYVAMSSVLRHVTRLTQLMAEIYVIRRFPRTFPRQ